MAYNKNLKLSELPLDQFIEQCRQKNLNAINNIYIGQWLKEALKRLEQKLKPQAVTVPMPGTNRTGLKLIDQILAATSIEELEQIKSIPEIIVWKLDMIMRKLGMDQDGWQQGFGYQHRTLPDGTQQQRGNLERPL